MNTVDEETFVKEKKFLMFVKSRVYEKQKTYMFV